MWLSAYLIVCCAFTPSRRTSSISFHTIWLLSLQVGGPMGCNHIRIASVYYTEIAANKEDEYPSAMKLLSVWRNTEYVAVSFVDKCSNPVIHSRQTLTCCNTKRAHIFLLRYPAAFCLLSRRLAF